MSVTRWYVDVDIVIEEIRSAAGHLSVQGPVRDDLKARSLTSRILTAVGPAGCPEVRLTGSRMALTKYLADHGYDAFAHPLKELHH